MTPAQYHNLKTVCGRYTGCPQDIEDATQDAFLKSLRFPHKPKRGGSYMTWMFVLGKSCAVDINRRKSRYVYDVAEGDLVHSHSALTPEDALLGRESLDSLTAAVLALPGGSRDVTYLTLRGMTIAEIARTLGRSEALCSIHLHRGKKRLTHAMREAGE